MFNILHTQLMFSQGKIKIEESVKDVAKILKYPVHRNIRWYIVYDRYIYEKYFREQYTIAGYLAQSTNYFHTDWNALRKPTAFVSA